MSESQKSGRAEHSATPQLDVPHEDRSSSRHASPVRLSAELALKVHTQWGRIASIKRVSETLPTSPEETSLEELNQLSLHLEETHKTFIKEHAYFEVSWPSALINHEYFTKNAHSEESLLYLAARRSISKLRHSFSVATPQPQSQATLNEPARAHSRLPDITLPKFSGDYSSWPAFRDLFSSMILLNQRLTNVEKLHYLRASLEGSAAQLISGLPMSGDSLNPSWDTLKDRYENPRLLIQSYLDQLLSNSGPVQRKATSLNRLINNVQESLKALESMGVSDTLGDAIMVHHVTRHLDRVTREQWETSIGAEREYPRFDQLVTFLTSRVRALESLESSPAQYVSNTPPKKAVAHQASQVKKPADPSSTFPCDCCNGQHYIVRCTKFRDFSPAERHKFAVDKRLCFNCLGRHNVRSCRSSMECKKCSQQHHTMLHEAHQAPTPSRPSTSSSSQPSN